MGNNSFSSWMDRRFQGPADVLLACLPELSDRAAAVGAHFDATTINNIHPSHFSTQGGSFYLLSRRKKNDGKQYAIVRLGYTGKGKGTVPIPIIKFSSYKLSAGSSHWFSPAKRLWAMYKADKRPDGKRLAPPSSDSISYSSSINQPGSSESLNSDTEAANKAAALASTKIIANSQSFQSTPSMWSHLGLPDADSPLPERVVVNVVESRLFSFSQVEWRTRKIALPRDIAIPLFDLTSGEIVNCQIISAPHGRKKRFLAGGKRSGICCTLRMRPGLPWIVAEGYKTSRAIHALEGRANVLAAMTANNVPAVVDVIRQLYPNDLIYTALDNDQDGRHYSNLSKANANGDITAPALFDGSDWADCLQELGFNETLLLWRKSFTI